MASYGEKFIVKYVIPLLKKGYIVVDIGCSFGKNTILMSEHVGDDGQIIGIDMSKKMISTASEKYSSIKNTKFVLCSAEDIASHPDIPSQVDIIISTTTLHWVKDIDLVIKNSYKILKPSGGMIMWSYVSGAEHHPNEITDIFETEKCYDYNVRMIDVYANKMLDPPERIPFNVWSIDTISKLVEENGFVDVDDSGKYLIKKILCPAQHKGKDIPSLIVNVAMWMNNFAPISNNDLEKRHEILKEAAKTIVTMANEKKGPILKHEGKDHVLYTVDDDEEGNKVLNQRYEMIEVFGKKK